MNNMCRDIEEYNPNICGIITDVLSNKTLNPIVPELFIRGIKLFCLVLITQSYFAVPKNIRLNSTHCFILNIPNKRELQQIVFNNLSDADFKDFMNLIIYVLQHHILFWLMMLFLHQIFPYVSERINHDNSG